MRFEGGLRGVQGAREVSCHDGRAFFQKVRLFQRAAHGTHHRQRVMFEHAPVVRERVAHGSVEDAAVQRRAVPDCVVSLIRQPRAVGRVQDAFTVLFKDIVERPFVFPPGGMARRYGKNPEARR